MRPIRRAQGTTRSRSIQSKRSLLQRAEGLGNIFRACRMMGDHREASYEVRRAFQVGGGPAQSLSRGRGVSDEYAYWTGLHARGIGRPSG